MQITLTQFETIDSLMADLLRMGEFETCADPRGYIRTSNRLFDACVDAVGYAYTNDFASSLECASQIVTLGLLNQIAVLDAEGV